MNDPATIEWTPAKLQRFKRRYNKAVEENVETFMFEGHELLVRYAKYLIEYLETQFKGS
jgi:hypothetical protein